MRSSHLQLATGLRYHLLEWDGPGETTFVLVHGFADVALGWCEVAPLLAAHGHVLACDLRGHGDSDWVGPGGYYHFMDYVADLDDVIRQRARDKVVLVGHSMGGSISGYYAGMRPERVSALVLLEGLGPPDQAPTEGPSRTALWVDRWRTARSKQKVMPSLDEAIRRLRKNDELLAPDLARRLAEASTRATEGGFVWKHDPLHVTMGPYAYRLETARRYWQRVTCPVLCVDGAQSKLNLHEAERASRRSSFANVAHLVLEDAGHGLQRHQPAKLAEAILGTGRSTLSPLSDLPTP